MKRKEIEDKEILRKQLQLLAERSKSATEDEIPKLSVAMKDIYEVLYINRRIVSFFAKLLVMFTNTSISIFVCFKKFFRS